MKLPKGKGMFIWRLYEYSRPEEVVKQLTELGIRHVCVKFADGRQDHPAGGPSYHFAIRLFLPLAKAAGIEVWGWPYIYGIDPAGEATVESRWFEELGFDGFIIDAEQEYKNRKQAARQYARALREALPKATIGLSSYWWRSMHPEFPWDEFLEVCDFIMPQVYWWGRDPVWCLQTSVNEFAKYNKPIVPTGAACDASYPVSGEEILAFAQAAVQLKVPAHNWWYLEGSQPRHRAAIAQIGTARRGPATLVAPIDAFATTTLNRTLHGRSVYRPVDVPGHNIFKGYSHWEQTGEGIGDGLDLSGEGWKTPVVAVCDGTITRWSGDTTQKEVVYLEAPGVTAVYAHIDYRPKPEQVPRKVRAGEPIGVLRGDLSSPHLHFELWLNDRALAAATPAELRNKMLAAFG